MIDSIYCTKKVILDKPIRSTRYILKQIKETTLNLSHENSKLLIDAIFSNESPNYYKEFFLEEKQSESKLDIASFNLR